MQIAVPANEAERLDELRRLDLGAAGREEAYDDLVGLASQWCEVPMAAVTLLDEQTQWLKAKVGLDVDCTPRSDSFCTHAILDPRELMIVPDTHADPRFVANAMVIGPPHIRFYAGAPLITSTGLALGTLCLLDIRPRTLSPPQEHTLRVLAQQICVLIELKREHLQLAQQQRFLHTVIDALHEGLIIRDAKQHLSLVNGSASALLGEPLHEQLGRAPQLQELRLLNLSGEPVAPGDWPDGRALRSGKAETGLLYRLQRRDGSELTLEFNTRTLQRDGHIEGVVMSMRDVTATKQLETQLLAEARFDALTGLPNRKEFHLQLAQALLRSRRHGTPLALAFLDVDEFKRINDCHGHAAGDMALKEFAARLRACVRQTDLVARLSGDEFTLVLEDVQSAPELAQLAEKLLATIRAPFRLNTGFLNLSTSMGLAVLAPGETAEALLARADAAMYAAKASGRNRYRIDPA